MTATVIKNIPPEIAYPLQKLVHGRLRARGPREHDGRKYWQSLPRKYATRFTLYTNNDWPKSYLKFAGIREDGKVRLTFNQEDKQ